jgi:hypothetical protein
VHVFVIVGMLSCSDDPAPEPDAGMAMDAEVDAGTLDSGIAPICDPMFAEPDACGGDPIGTWRYLALCGMSDAAKDLLAQCPEGTLSEAHDGRGRLLIQGDGTYDLAIQDDFVVSGTLPFSCVEDVGGCEGFATLVTILSGHMVACETGADRCSCVGAGTQVETSSGAWSAMGGVFTATKASGGVDRFWYCIDGDTTTLREIGKDLVLVVER